MKKNDLSKLSMPELLKLYEKAISEPDWDALEKAFDASREEITVEATKGFIALKFDKFTDYKAYLLTQSKTK